MRNLRWSLMLALVLALAGSPVLLAETPAPAVESPAPDIAVVLPVEAGASCAETAATDDLAELLAPQWQAASCCRNQCFRDRDCDALCGAKGAGACVQVNSCCRECFCAF